MLDLFDPFLSNLPSHSSRRHIQVWIWWHHLCSLIMTNHPLNHLLVCYSIVNWTFLCETTEDSVIFFVSRQKGEEIKHSPAYNLHTVVTIPSEQAVLTEMEIRLLLSPVKSQKAWPDADVHWKAITKSVICVYPENTWRGSKCNNVQRQWRLSIWTLAA